MICSNFLSNKIIKGIIQFEFTYRGDIYILKRVKMMDFQTVSWKKFFSSHRGAKENIKDNPDKLDFIWTLI